MIFIDFFKMMTFIDFVDFCKVCKYMYDFDKLLF